MSRIGPLVLWIAWSLLAETALAPRVHGEPADRTPTEERPPTEDTTSEAESGGPTEASPFRFPLPALVSGEIDIGGRTTWGDEGAGKLREYRDFANGVLGRVDLLLEDEERTRYLRLQGTNLGYDDQRYRLEAGRYGHHRVDVFYSELPHVFSSSARTLFQRPSGNQFRLPEGVQTRIAGAADAATQLSTELTAARSTDLGFRQIEGGTGVDYQLSPTLRLFSRYRIRDRQGSRPLAIQYGSPGGRFDVFASPVDDDTHQVDAGLEWLSGPFTAGLHYLGSIYRNEFRGASVDNPFVALDASTAAARGRISLEPDNSAHAVSAFGSLVVPAAFPARISGSLAYGFRRQNQDFLPHTINGAIASPLLADGSLDGEVHTLDGSLLATARPLPALNLKARYRINRFDDATDPIRFASWVRNDDALRSDPVRSVRNDYLRQTAEVAADLRIRRSGSARLEYALESWQRSDDRQVRELVEHGPAAELAWRFDERAALRARYAFRSREGDGYQTLSFLRSKLDPADFADLRSSGIHELRSLRRADQADRRQHRVDLSADLMPSEATDLSLHAGWTQTDYHDSRFGLTSERGVSTGIDASHRFGPRVRLGAWYTFEWTRSDQNLRWRPRTFAPPITLVDDPRNDWRTRDAALFHSLGTTLDLVAIPDRLDFALGYQLHLGEEEIRDRAAQGFVGTGGVGVGADGGAAFRYPNVREALRIATGEARLHLTDPLTLYSQYRFESFEIRDFRSDDLGPDRGGNDVYLGNVIEDYDAHVLVVGARVAF